MTERVVLTMLYPLGHFKGSLGSQSND